MGRTSEAPHDIRVADFPVSVLVLKPLALIFVHKLQEPIPIQPAVSNEASILDATVADISDRAHGHGIEPWRVSRHERIVAGLSALGNPRDSVLLEIWVRWPYEVGCDAHVVEVFNCVWHITETRRCEDDVGVRGW